MRKTEATSRINAVAVAEINMKLAGSAKEFAIEATSALLNDKQPGPLGKSKYTGPWPKEVTDAADLLRSEMEEHLLRVYFEVGDDRASRSTRGTGGGADAARKQGIVQPPMERPDDEPPQL
jgi:hypothetical protein